MPDQRVFLLPDVGEGLTEADVVTWHVKVGDTVAVNDVLADIETAKSIVELPSPFAGVVLELHGAVGETLDVGCPLITIDASGHAAVPTAAPVSVHPPPEPSSEPPLVLVGTAPKEAVARRVRIQRPSESPSVTLDAGEPPASTVTRVPVRGVRKATAEAMVRSAFTAPQATMWATVDVSATTRLVRRLRGDRAWADVRVTPLLLVARAVAFAVRRHPEINASWDDETQEIVQKSALGLGIAAATPRGLMVPVVHDAGRLTLRELALALDDLIASARSGKLSPEQMSNGTLTLTNVGVFGVDGATPLLNPPEAAIIAVGAIQTRPWVVKDRIEPRDVMTLSMSIDHRLVDGELGGKVLRHVAELLSDPGQAFL